MSFLVFEKSDGDESGVFRPTGVHFSLAGYNLLHRAWERLGRPLDTGWHVSRADLLDLHFGSGPRPQDPRLIIDFHPSATGRIGLVEPMDIYAWTFSDGKGRAVWTPLMLGLQDAFYEEYEAALTPEAKAAIMERIPASSSGGESIEFLYLNGEDRSWNWGRNGMTNAAFINGGARDYFRRFF